MRIALAAGIAILMASMVILAMAFTSAGPATAGSGGLGTASSGGTSGGDGGGKYDRLWRKTTRREHRWARKVSQCESGGNARIHGGGGTYHGAFQFTLSTWRSAPKSPGGDPHTRPWKTQAVVAIYLKRRAGSSPWPNCG